MTSYHNRFELDNTLAHYSSSAIERNRAHKRLALLLNPHSETLLLDIYESVELSANPLARQQLNDLRLIRISYGVTNEQDRLTLTALGLHVVDALIALAREADALDAPESKLALPATYYQHLAYGKVARKSSLELAIEYMNILIEHGHSNEQAREFAKADFGLGWL